MNKLFGIVLFSVFLVSCSHNPAVFTFGKQVKIGTTEYGELTWLNGIAIVDCSRENSEWTIKIDEKTGIQYDTDSGVVKGITEISRRIGKQVTGYLVDLAEVDSKSTRIYLKDSPEVEENKESKQK